MPVGELEPNGDVADLVVGEGVFEGIGDELIDDQSNRQSAARLEPQRLCGDRNRNRPELAHGISVALYNTLLGIAVAIPAVIFYRHFRNRVDHLVIEMESQAIKLIEIVHGERRA